VTRAAKSISTDATITFSWPTLLRRLYAIFTAITARVRLFLVSSGPYISAHSRFKSRQPPGFRCQRRLHCTALTD
jgi:hypothetical protein